MPESNSRLYHLLELYSSDACSRDELSELARLVSEADDAEMHVQLDHLFEQLHGEVAPEGYDLDDMYRAIVPPERGSVRRVWIRYVAAASVLLLFGIGSYFTYLFKKPATIPQSATVVHDVAAPQSNRATITLSNGQTIFLDSSGNGTLAVQNNISLVKTADGKILYNTSSPGGGKSDIYNTLVNPRGSKAINMTLSDGSQVWLNAASSITYPVAFTGNERKVTMTGEAYFEITPLSRGRGAGGEAKMSFIVEKGDMQVTVLGTHFNVNAYNDENDIKVTLLEGSVKVSRATESVMMKPGQQAVLPSAGGKRLGVMPADLEQVMAWKNGKFNFGRKAGIQSVMRQIARWYDVEVIYEDGIPLQQFGGEMPRDTRLSQVLEILKTSGVKFSIEGKRVLIRP